MFGTGNPREEFVAAKGASETALRLDSTLAVAFIARGMVQLFGEQNYASAQRDFQAAIHLDSSQYQPWLYRTWCFVGAGKLDSAVMSIRRAYSLDPVQPIVGVRLAEVLRYRGDTAEARERVTEVLRRDTSNILAHVEQLRQYTETNQCAKALKEVRWIAGDPHVEYGAVATAVWALCGQKERARQFADSIEKGRGYVSPFWLASAYAALGDSAKVFHLLDQSITDHEGVLFLLGQYGAFRPYHGHPAFTQLLKRAGAKG
jgi:tetratricopeptide (TPR) repeat protein